MIFIYLFVFGTEGFSIVRLQGVMCEMPLMARRGLNEVDADTGGHIFHVLAVLGVHIYLTGTAKYFHTSDFRNTCWT